MRSNQSSSSTICTSQVSEPQLNLKLELTPEADFLFQNHGSICLLKPLTPAGEAWFNEHLPVDNPETQFWGGSIVIEPRYADDILQGIHIEGLLVEVQ